MRQGLSLVTHMLCALAFLVPGRLGPPREDMEESVGKVGGGSGREERKGYYCRA